MSAKPFTRKRSQSDSIGRLRDLVSELEYHECMRNCNCAKTCNTCCYQRPLCVQMNTGALQLTDEEIALIKAHRLAKANPCLGGKCNVMTGCPPQNCCPTCGRMC